MTNSEQTTPAALDDFPALYARTARFSLGSPRNLKVIDRGRRVLFCRSSAFDDPVLCLWSLDVETGVETMLVDPAGLAATTDDLPPAERARRERARESGSGIVAYSVDGAGKRCCFTLGGSLFVVDLTDGSVESLPSTGAVFDPRFNSPGTAIAYTDGGDLRLCKRGAGGERANGDDAGAGPWGDRLLRADEDPLVSHGRAEFVAAEEMGRGRGYWWSPEGDAILATRVDESPVATWWIAQPANPERAPNPIRYPAAGTANARVELELLDLEGAVQRVAWDDDGRFEYLANVVWQADHRPLVVRQTRDQRLISIAELAVEDDGDNPEAPNVAERLTIVDDVWVELLPGSPLPCEAGLLTIEDRSTDAGAARRLVLDGKPVGPPDLNVRSIVGVVEPGGNGDATDHDEPEAAPAAIVTVWTDPTEVHLAVVPLQADSTTATMLTTEPGVHGATFGSETLVVSSAHPDRPGGTVSVTRFGAGEALAIDEERITIADHAAEPGFDAAPTFLTLGRDQLSSALFLPTDHDGTSPLPVLLDPYGGPHAQRVLKNHNPHLVSRWFAEQGYAVLVTDGRGTPGRGPDWERSVWGDLAGPVLDDQLAALDDALDRYAMLDGDRVAIRGWSFGGYLAALAALRRPDRVHAAIAGAPVTLWNLYDTHYTERYLGHPDAHPEHYAQSNLWVEGDDGPLLDRLQRPMLLIHGLADDNVVAAHTLRFSTALLVTGSPHRVLPLSGVTHMTPQEAVAENLLRLQLDFLDESLRLDAGDSP